MILHQIFLILLNIKKKIIKIFLSIFFFSIFVSISHSIQIKNLISINNLVITNVDFANELQFNRIMLNKSEFNKIEQNLIFESLIKEKIKELEIKEEKIKISDNQINKRVEQIIQQLKNTNKENENKINFIKEKLKEKIYIQSAWDELIFKKFSRNLNVNLSEINERAKTKKIEKDKIENLIQIEKQKKIVSNSETYYNEIKQKYFLKRFDE